MGYQHSQKRYRNRKRFGRKEDFHELCSRASRALGYLREVKDEDKGRRIRIFTKKRSRNIFCPTEEYKKNARALMRWFRASNVRNNNKACIGGEIRRSRFDLSNEDIITRCRTSPTSEWTKNAILIKIDLKDAFESIPDYYIASTLKISLEKLLDTCIIRKDSVARESEIYKDAIASEGVCRKFLYYLDEICSGLCYGDRLSVGSPTSPLLFNLVLYKVDSRIHGLLKKILENNDEEYCARRMTNNWVIKKDTLPCYYRYIDDLTVVCKDRHRWIRHTIRNILESEGLEVNKSKSRVLPLLSGWPVLGMSLGSKKIFAPKKFRRRLRQLKWRRDTLNDLGAGKTLEGMINSVPDREYRDYLMASVNETNVKELTISF